ncbi:CMRF35-like molecule 8 isoform X2 [Mugil cephalus]|uniref:CMRF35-like molecule 8 isoform X2 n=1 Tax=Mugil cephalus TaxID=48193 RepID=UPI001FB7FD78|nr:CMRF35-like molecule 8 isoform X2 [Mugil cephalus]
MRASLEVTVILMTAFTSLLTGTGNTGGRQSIVCEHPPENQTAHVGGSVTISCNYQKVEEGTMKSLCRADGDLNCKELLATYRSDHTVRDRFSLKDDGQRGVYTVNISELTLEDAGTYWCALKRVDENSSSCLTEIHLHVLDWDDFTPNQSVHVTSKTATITCNYPHVFENHAKFLCKGKTPFKCVDLINTTEPERDITKGRFHIRDNKRKKFFYVNISELSTADSGTYWCHCGRTTQPHEYTKILLSVGGTRMGGPPEREVDGMQSTTVYVFTNKIRGQWSFILCLFVSCFSGVIIGIAVCSALLVVAVVLLILYKRKLLRITACCAAGESSEQRTDTGQNTEGNNGENHYEEIQLENQQVTSLQSVYATVNPPPDLLHYASVSYHKDGNALPDTDARDSSAAISGDQGATRPPEAAEATLYSTVTQRVEQ